MEVIEGTNSQACPSPEISAYIDGELSAADELRLESHVAQCPVCNEDLNLQKSFLNALDSSLDDVRSIELPANFTKSVMTNAESRVSGLRRPNERRNAALICIGLLGVSFLALGGNGERMLSGLAAAGEKLFAIVAAAAHFVYDMALGSAIVIRSLAGYFVFGSASNVLFLLLIFVLSLLLFSKLIVRFHRT